MWCQLKEMVLFGEHLSNKGVILPIHYSSINWHCSQKKQLSLPPPLISATALVPLCLYSLPCDSVADPSTKLVLADASLGNTKLLVLRQISLLIHLICQWHKICPWHRERVAGSGRWAGDSRREGLVPLAAGLACRSLIRCKTAA